MRAITATIVITLFLRSLSFAESPYERDLKQLKEQEEKAISAATDPIKRRYKESLDDLLRRATQANDLDAGVKIKEELTQLGLDPAAGSSSMIPSFAEKLTKQAWTWTSHPGGRDKLEFTHDGHVIHNGWANATWTLKKPNLVIMTMGAMTSTLRFNDAMTTFEGVDFGNTHPVKGEHY